MANQPPPSFSLGIEEEYLLVDRDTRDLVPDPPPTMLEECQQRLEGRVSPEFLRCQIEVGTRVCSSLAEARADLADLRATVAEVAGRHGLAPIAAATHPFASWTAQKPTERERYLTLARDMQAPARRLIICGLHVHVGLEDPQLRIDLVGQVAYFLPHLLALSTSSPFWRSNDTGLKSYRIAVFNEMPRTGLPESFDSFAEYERHLAVLVKAGLHRGRHQACGGTAARAHDSRPWSCAFRISARGSTTALPSPRSIAASCACYGGCVSPISAGAGTRIC
jgi:carboxylate-amine ligase